MYYIATMDALACVKIFHVLSEAEQQDGEDLLQWTTHMRFYHGGSNDTMNTVWDYWQ